MIDYHEFRKPGLLTRAELLAWKYRISERRVLKILKRCKVTRLEHASSQHCDYLWFEPSLEDALVYLRTEIALKAFEKDDLSLTHDVLNALVSLMGLARREMPVEELCRWKAVSRLYSPPDDFHIFHSEDDPD